jgi:acyl-CoA thioester hydrolase
MKEHKIEIRVRWGDTDTAGIVYYPNIFHYFEIGFEEFFRAIGMDYKDVKKYGITFPRVEAKARFHAPARFGDLLELTIRVEGIKEKAITFGFDMKREDELVATGSVTIVAVDVKKWRAIPMPRGIIDKLK